MKRVLFLDDEDYRMEFLGENPGLVNELLKTSDPEPPELHWAKNLGEFKEIFPKGKWDLIMLDHDLADFQVVNGEMRELNGKTAVLWLLDNHSPRFADSNILDGTLVVCHTMSPDKGIDMCESLKSGGIRATRMGFNIIMGY